MESEKKEVAVFTMDLQSVKLAPVLKTSAIYTKWNYACIILRLLTKEVFCYLGHEAEGGLDANVFATIIIKYLSRILVINAHTATIILCSDSCGYQNRNCTLSNAIYKFANETDVAIIQKFMEIGHTQMEVDSVHSLIEAKLKNKDIQHPFDYIEVCKKSLV